MNKLNACLRILLLQIAIVTLIISVLTIMRFTCFEVFSNIMEQYSKIALYDTSTELVYGEASE